MHRLRCLQGGQLRSTGTKALRDISGPDSITCSSSNDHRRVPRVLTVMTAPPSRGVQGQQLHSMKATSAPRSASHDCYIHLEEAAHVTAVGCQAEIDRQSSDLVAFATIADTPCAVPVQTSAATPKLTCSQCKSHERQSRNQ